MRKEDHLLKQLEENVGPKPSPKHTRILKKLEKHHFLIQEDGAYQLTERGREAIRIGTKKFLRLEKRGQGAPSEKRWLRRSIVISLFFVLLLSLYIFYVLFRNTHIITS